MLLFAVAVLAANFSGFRRFYELVEYRTAPPYCIMPAGVGALPLANVALIATLLYMARRLPSLHPGHTGNLRSSFSGIAFFSLHFLMLGWLLSCLVPNAIDRCAEMLGAPTVYPYAARGWAAVIGQTHAPVPWIIFDCLILGFFISGPPLLLSWIGQALAIRCAATLPRHRFRMMTCLVSLGFAGAALAICLTPRPFEAEKEVDIDFQVVDEVSGRPMAAAFLRLTDPFSLDQYPVTPKAFTDANGQARLTGRFVVSGQRNAFQTLGLFSPWGRWLEVSAVDHPTRRIPLTEVVGPFADPARPVLRKVSLAGGATRKNPFRDLAGVYCGGGGFGGRWFEIEADGRFAWCESGCRYRTEEYGYMKRHDGEIELIPIPHPGRDIDPLVTVRYRAIEWGSRLYLSSTDEHELAEFCREALTPSRPSKSEDPYGKLLRQSDRDKPQSGLPRLPAKVWVTFLASEIGIKQ
jgi:hypothetical protein